MRGGVVLGLSGMVAVVTAAMAEERRELSTHEHGRSTLNIAIEGTRVAMELTAPGMDIVGFEHAAATDEQKAAVDRARAALADPLALFVPPQGADCQVAEATVGFETEGRKEEHAGGERREEDEAAQAEAEEEEGGHTEFHAEYALDCADPSALGSITFTFFERFPEAEEVEVTLLTERGQTSHEVERDRPRLALDGGS